MGLMEDIKRILAAGAASSMTFKEFLEVEIKRWKGSPQRRMMLDGKRYYDGDHDILRRKREVIVENGARMEDINLPNNKLVDNQFAKMVDQKTNYLLSKPITYESEDETHTLTYTHTHTHTHTQSSAFSSHIAQGFIKYKEVSQEN